jgi:hypothetical protein
MLSTPPTVRERISDTRGDNMADPGISDDVPDWMTAIAIAIAIAILLVVFIWIVVRLEPVLSDFVATNPPAVTATPED